MIHRIVTSSLFAAGLAAGLLVVAGCNDPGIDTTGRKPIAVGLNSDGDVTLGHRTMKPKAFAERLNRLGVPKSARITVDVREKVSHETVQRVFRDICSAGYRNVIIVTPVKASSSTPKSP